MRFCLELWSFDSSMNTWSDHELCFEAICFYRQQWLIEGKKASSSVIETHFFYTVYTTDERRKIFEHITRVVSWPTSIASLHFSPQWGMKTMINSSDYKSTFSLEHNYVLLPTNLFPVCMETRLNFRSICFVCTDECVRATRRYAGAVCFEHALDLLMRV